MTVPDEKLIGLRTQFFLPALQFEHPTLLHSRMLTEKGVIKGQTLHIAQENIQAQQ